MLSSVGNFMIGTSGTVAILNNGCQMLFKSPLLSFRVLMFYLRILIDSLIFFFSSLYRKKEIFIKG